MSGIKTLGQFIIEKQADFPYAKGELSRLLRDIGIASKIVNREVQAVWHLTASSEYWI
jgi:fructose-1,6-bisphosphatase I